MLTLALLKTKFKAVVSDNDIFIYQLFYVTTFCPALGGFLRDFHGTSFEKLIIYTFSGYSDKEEAIECKSQVSAVGLQAN